MVDCSCSACEASSSEVETPVRGAGVLLADLVELLDRLIDLGRTDVLLAAGRGDLLHQLRGLLDVVDELGQHLARLLRDLDAFRRERADVRRSPPAALGELAHFGGNHRKAPCRARRRGGFHRRVERQQVVSWRAISCTMVIFSAMVCIASTARSTATPLAFGVLGRLRRNLLVLVGVVGRSASRSRHLLHRGGGFLGDEACSVAPCESCSALAESSWLPAETLLPR